MTDEKKLTKSSTMELREEELDEVQGGLKLGGTIKKKATKGEPGGASGPTGVQSPENY